MTDLKVGTTDIANVKVGTTQIAKVMLGTTELWNSGGGVFTPTLIDSFTALAGTGNATTKSYTVPSGKTIPVGSLLIVGSAQNGSYVTDTCADNANDAGSANTYSLRSSTSIVNGTTVMASIFVCIVTREIDAGEIITTTGGNKNRGAAVIAWFTGTGFADTTINGSATANSGTSAAWSSGNQGTDSTGATLDLCVVCGSASTPPYAFSDMTEIGETVTTAGSADRSVALGYRVSTSSGERAAAGTNTSAIWAAGVIALGYTP